MLDPKRILVGSASNFGEALADANQLPGSFFVNRSHWRQRARDPAAVRDCRWAGLDAGRIRADVQLAGPPNPALIGGVYAGSLTNRTQQVIPGAMNTAAVGTALLGHSPDGSGKAVFAVAYADGSLVQAHTLKGLDGLATAITIAPMLRRREDEGDDDEDHAQPRVGVLLNYSPFRTLYVSEPFSNSIAVAALWYSFSQRQSFPRSWHLRVSRR